VAVYCHGVYGPESILEGQSRRVFVAHFDSAEKALEAYPGADVLNHSTKIWRGDSLEEISGLSASTPGWFDPRDAGERWDSDY